MKGLLRRHTLICGMVIGGLLAEIHQRKGGGAR